MPKGICFRDSLSRLSWRTIRKNHLSYSEAMRKYWVCGKMSIQKWERIYLEEGPEGLGIEKRGRSNQGRPPKFARESRRRLNRRSSKTESGERLRKKIECLGFRKATQRQKVQ